MNLFGVRSKKLDTEKPISLGEVSKYIGKPGYLEYDFPPVYDESGKLKGYQPQLRQEVERKISEIRGRRNPNFEQNIVAGGIYKGIDKGIGKKYGNYQDTRGYRKSKRER